MDTSSILGYKPTDPTQNLSGMLNIVNSMQQNQRGDMALQNEAINLNERKAAIPFLQSGAFLNDDGTLDTAKLTTGLTKIAPTTGMKMAQEYAAAHTQATAANAALNSLTNDNRVQFGNSVASLDPNAPPDLVQKTFDTLGKQLKGSGPVADAFRKAYESHLSQGPAAAMGVVKEMARGMLPQTTQRELNTPNVVQVGNGQQTKGINIAPGVQGIPQGGQVFSVQQQIPPTATTVVPGTNQPAYVGPQPSADPENTPERYDAEIKKATASLANLPPTAGDSGRQQLLDHIANMQRLRAVAAAGPNPVPAGPVPGANESKAGTIQGINDHWTRLNQQAENSPLLEGVLQNIKALAPGAATGTHAGIKAYVSGALSALHIPATGDLQKDTDLLEKNMAQLNLGTPAATDAVRTIVGAARPHGAMNEKAIQEASDQLLGQVRANRAVRDALTVPKQVLDARGDTSAYTSTRQHLEEAADPRIWEFESKDKAGKAEMLSRMQPEDRAAMRKKIEQLQGMGMLK